MNECETVPRRARFQGTRTFVSLNSRLESDEEETRTHEALSGSSRSPPQGLKATTKKDEKKKKRSRKKKKEKKKKKNTKRRTKKEKNKEEEGRAGRVPGGRPYQRALHHSRLLVGVSQSQFLRDLVNVWR